MFRSRTAALVGSIKLADVRDTAAVTTVDQAKGFEYGSCAIHSDLLSPGSENERNIRFVSFTRQKKIIGGDGQIF